MTFPIRSVSDISISPATDPATSMVHWFNGSIYNITRSLQQQKNGNNIKSVKLGVFKEENMETINTLCWVSLTLTFYLI